MDDDDKAFVGTWGRLGLCRRFEGYPWRFRWRRWYYQGRFTTVTLHLFGPFELYLSVEGWRWAEWLDGLKAQNTS